MTYGYSDQVDSNTIAKMRVIVSDIGVSIEGYIVRITSMEVIVEKQVC